MITALNTTLIGMGRVPTCIICTDDIEVPACTLEAGKRVRRVSHPALHGIGDYVPLYSDGDAAYVDCPGCCKTQFCGVQQTPVDGRYTIFVSEGDVYARINAGRHGQLLTTSAKIILTTGKKLTVNRVVSIYTRSQVSTCLQEARSTT